MVKIEKLKTLNCKVRKNFRKKDYLKSFFLAFPIMSILVPYLCTKITKSQRINLILAMTIDATFILLYVKIFLKKFKECLIFEDPLNLKLFNVPFLNFGLSSWPLTHYVYYFSLAYFYPSEIKSIFIFGVIWEIIESLLKIYTAENKIEGRSKVTRITNENGKVYIEYTTYWDSSYKDIILNSLGILSGKILYSYINK